MIGKMAATFLCAAIYTAVRYILFGDVEVTHLPAFLMNKSVAMTAVIFLCFAGLAHRRGDSDGVARWGTAAWCAALLHTLLSLSLLGDAYYPKLFGEELMNLSGELTVLFGALAMCCFWLLARLHRERSHLRAMQVLACVCVAAHLVGMGILGWLNVGGWHSGLPPISLISFLFAVLALVLFLGEGRKEPG